MCEESGEALKEALNLTRTSIRRDTFTDQRDLIKLFNETEQTVATGLMLLCNIKSRLEREFNIQL